MKHLPASGRSLVCGALLVLSSGLLHAQPPGILNHQGRIAVGGVNYDGTGYLKAALVDSAGTTTYWSNAPTVSGGEPSAAVAVTVVNGHYAVGLGDDALADMDGPIPAGVFTDNPDVRLRLWFSTDNVTFEQLSPDSRITSAGYALSASEAATVADGAVTSSMLADGAVTDGKLAAGSITADALSDGAVTGDKLAAASVTSSSIADGAVTTQKVEATYLSKSTSGDPSGLDYTSLPGEVTYTASFDPAFPDGSTQLIKVVFAESDWQLSASPADLSESGFEAVFPVAPVVVDDAGDVGLSSSLATIFSRPAISYFDETSDELMYALRGLPYPFADDIVFWTTSTVDSVGSVGRHNSLIALADGRPAISYLDETNDDLKFAISSGPASTTFSTTAVDTTGSVGEYNSLALIDGRPAISYWDATNADLKFAINSLPDGSGTWSVSAIETAGIDGLESSLALVDGRPAIGHRQVFSDSLLFTINSQADGSGTWSTIFVATLGSFESVGSSISLALLDDGRPAIAYRDSSDSSLKFAVSAQADGLGAWSIYTVESGLGIGISASLVIVDGRPAISYVDNALGQLKFAVNDQADGSGVWSSAVADTGPVGLSPSLALIDLRPAISYYDISGGDLKYVQLPAEPNWYAAVNPTAFPIHSVSALTANSAGSAATATTAETALSADTALTADTALIAQAVEANAIGGGEIADGSIDAVDLNPFDIGIWATNGPDVYRSSGEVGIGTSNPAGALHVVGDTLATGTATAGDFSFPSARTYNLNIAGSALLPRDGQAFFRSDLGFIRQNDSPINLYTDVQLPQGATITAARVRYLDNSTTGSFTEIRARLRRRALSTIDTENIGTVTATETLPTSASSVVRSEPLALTSSRTVVDNNSYHYFMLVQATNNAPGDDLLRIYGFEITYTLDTLAP